MRLSPARAAFVTAGSGVAGLRHARAMIAGEVLFRATRWLIASADLRVYGDDAVLAAKAAGRPVLFVGWHGHDFVNLGVFHPIFGFDAHGAIMVRDNADGLALHELGKRMRIEVISLGERPGTPRWARGVVSMIGLIRQQVDGLLAVDGPDGPPGIAKPGAGLIAQRAGAVLVPSAVACSPAIRLRNRWDDHLIPLPGARIVVHFGPIIDARPPNDTPPDLEDLRVRIERALDDGVARATALCKERTRADEWLVNTRQQNNSVARPPRQRPGP